MSRYHLLIDKFIAGTISTKERETLERWVLQREANMSFFKSRLKESSRRLSADFDADAAYQRFSETLKSRGNGTRPFRMVLKYAAVIVLLLSIGFLAKRQLFPGSSVISTKVVDTGEQLPIGNEIMIKLADGTAKVLNSEGNETVTDTQGNIVATQDGNALTFDTSKESAGKVPIYNEVYIPYGQIFKLALSDGTLVWLNSGSKLRFPQRFVDADSTRMVYLEGEAFFEVAENRNKPFVVNTQELDIKVFGTQFNISSYETETHIATTLVEGSVGVYESRSPENGIRLIPSFQANYDKFGNSFSKAKVDTDIYTAWMQDRLVIDNLKFSEILVKLERRYAVKIVNKAESLNDEIYKGEFVSEDIESVLETISLSTPFNYEINQNVITITE